MEEYEEYEYLDFERENNFDVGEQCIENRYVHTAPDDCLFHVTGDEESIETKGQALAKITRKRKKKITREFSTDEKKLLARLVENRPEIWDLQEKFHSNIHALAETWKQISKHFSNCTESDCRAAWGNLRNSARYHNNKPNKSKKGRTGDSASADELSPNEYEEPSDWEFSKCMNFLKPMWKKYPRKTSVLGMQFQKSSPLTTTNGTVQSNKIDPIEIGLNDRYAMEIDDVSNIEESEQIDSNYTSVGNDLSISNNQSDDFDLNNRSVTDETGLSFDGSNNRSVTEDNDLSLTASNGEHDTDRSYGELSNYAYSTSSKKKDVLTESVVNITKSITELVMCRKKDSGRIVQQEERLKFDYMWRHFDKLFQKLSDEDVDELNFAFMHLIHEKLKKL